MVTLSRLLSPQLLRHCNTLVQYDYDHDVTSDEVTGISCRRIALRSLQTPQPESVDKGIGL